MSRILLAGCGYVGTATADLFHDAGWEVEGWTASAESAVQLSQKPYPVRAVDLTDRAAVGGASSHFEAIILAASTRGGGVEAYRKIYLEAARNLIAIFRDSLLLFTSSTSVYAQTGGEWVTEESPAEPERETGRILREAENVVLAHGGIVARLAGIYGPGRSALLTKFLEDRAVVESGDERWINQIHRDDVAAALLHLVGQDASDHFSPDPPRIFNVTDNHPISQGEAYAWLAAQLGRAMPSPAESPPQRKRGNGNKRVSSAKLQTLGWAPRYPTFQVAMSESILPSFGIEPPAPSV